jgi:hypothetical protein
VEQRLTPPLGFVDELGRRRKRNVMRTLFAVAICVRRGSSFEATGTSRAKAVELTSLPASLDATCLDW